MPRGTCWKGYAQKGMKMKNGRSVPNCVPVQKAYLGKAIKQPSETENEFKIRHEMHTPFMDVKKEKIVKAQVGKGIKKDREYKKGQRLSKYESYSEQDILENRDAKTSNSEILEEDVYQNMPSIRGVAPEGFKEPIEIKKGGLITGKPKLALRGWK
jgi:hypothetical protein